MKRAPTDTAGGGEKKIAYVVTARHGLEAFVYTEIEALNRLGCTISLFTTKYGSGPYMPRPDWVTYRAKIAAVLGSQFLVLFRHPAKYARLLGESIRMGTFVDFLIGMHYGRIMKRAGIGHIHCHMGDRKLFVGYYAHRLSGIPLSVTVHAHEMVGSAPKPDGRMFRLALGRCENILTVSEFNKRYLIDHHRVPAEKISVVRLFAGKDRVKGRLSRKKLLMVANWVPKKGHAFLLQALKSLDRDDWELWIVGRPVDLGRQRTIDVGAMVEEMQMHDRVKVIGEVSDEALAALYQACDIFCVPSVVERDTDGTVLDQEGLPEVLKEAMAYGKPVVSTRHTGIPELLEEVLVAEDDVEGLRQAIEGLLDSEEKRRRLGQRNRELVDEMYTNRDLTVMARIFLH